MSEETERYARFAEESFNDMTSVLQQEMKEKSERHRFNVYAHDFFLRYAPTDPYERARFEADFFSLVREMHRYAIDPFVEQLTTLYAMMPPRPIVFPKDPTRMYDDNPKGPGNE